ncbi:hypothetical protein B0T16DRAFT_384425 [Cercophora newfieldiana]|uniref:SET domain-containing protein n=1 Tax=Cercophora newfieldiana TaxID=92897 RepID=A0AA40CXW1_9PEZI|nr:hypothetical protein B0T16DRAFT_384425 [Cercophora newfieldiana]
MANIRSRVNFKSDDGFDASKQSKLPDKFLRNAPKDEPAVRIGFVSAAVGYGLFAARPFKQDEFIFTEAPILSSLFHEANSDDPSLTKCQLAAYRNALETHGNELTAAYPVLAASHGFPPPAFDEVEPVLNSDALGKFLAHGRFAGSTITREEYETFTSKIRVNPSPSDQDCRLAVRNFFRHYAFDARKNSAGGVPGGAKAVATQAHGACIYLLGSLVNHCCTPRAPRFSRTEEAPPPVGPNCCWRIGPQGLAKFIEKKHICVQARRDIEEGEQLTWDYGKRDLGFVCECSTCRPPAGSRCSVM